MLEDRVTDEKIDWLSLVLIREGKEKSRALESHKYTDRGIYGSFGKPRGKTMERQSDKEIADSLLIEWYRWSKVWRPKLGAPRVAPYCQQSTTSKQYDDPSDLTYDKVYQDQMKAVDFCMDAIEVAMQQAIGTEMRNREANAKVWRSPINQSYASALFVIMPVMRKRGLFD
ncbi:MAG: hypothetical protein ACXU8A_00195 [Burkholderiaceae bacterium]